jgi:hypothetical protein
MKSKTTAEFLFIPVYKPKCENHILPYAMPGTALPYSTQTAKAFSATHFVNIVCLILFYFTLQFCVLSDALDCTGCS